MVELLVALLGGVGAQGDLPADFSLGPPPGTYCCKADAPEPGFEIGRPLVATSYFYWYDAPSGAHVKDADGTDALTDHPGTLEGFSYRSVDWHARQLRDMMAAGIDVAMPVYWGSPLSGMAMWSNEGIPPLIAARERLLAEGKSPPRIGMFYDTSTLQFNEGGFQVDLTVPAGQRWFYGTIRNFFSLVPAEHRALVDGRPLVFLYARAFAKDADEKLFPAVRAMFRADFGTDLFLVKMADWPGPADSVYQWGGAVRPQMLETAGIGPGYDHSAVPGRTPLIRARENGRFYERSWEMLLRMDPKKRPWLVHLETWNEYHEGTDLAESAEYGRKYIELTGRFAGMFHAGERMPGGAWQAVLSGEPDRAEGVAVLPLPDGDGPITPSEWSDRPGWSTRPNRFQAGTEYMYFDVDDFLMVDVDEPVEITVTYLDAGARSFALHYDSADPALSGIPQYFRDGGSQAVGATNTWKEAVFRVPHARFINRANGGDFRLAAFQGTLTVARVAVRRLAEPKP